MTTPSRTAFANMAPQLAAAAGGHLSAGPPVQREAGFFGTTEASLFGWWHRPAAGGADLAVVLVPPLGQEMLNSWRTQQALADALAAAGLPCLRLDLAGCGNAADPPEDPELGALPAWQASLDMALDHLLAASGASRAVVLAMRSGVLVAAPVAARRPDVQALVAVAPVVSGRSMLREWRALAATAALPAAHADGTLEVLGAVFSPPTQQALMAANLAELDWPVARPILLLDRDDLPGAARWQASLQARGVPLTCAVHGGMADMLADAHLQRVPQALVQAVVVWVGQQTSAALGLAATAAPPLALDAQEDLGAAPAPGHLPNLDSTAALRPSAAVAPGVVEQVWRLSLADTVLWGVLSVPAAEGAAPGAAQSVAQCPRGRVVVLPNTGGVHHVGGHRLFVQLARHLAAAGHVVLRFDLSGLGQSPAHPGEPADVVYGRRAVDDLAAVVRALQQQWPQREPVALGLCAGGYHAWRLAVREASAAACVIVNPLTYHWHDGMSLDAHEPDLQAAYYRAKWRKWESWQRLLSGRSDLRMLAFVATQRLRGLAAAAWQGLRSAPAGGARLDDLQVDLQAAAAHGVRLQFVFSANEPGWPALQAQAGELLARLQRDGQVCVHHLAQADHTLSTASTRQRFLVLVQGLLADAPAAQAQGAAASAAASLAGDAADGSVVHAQQGPASSETAP